jgi:hypothetical protein
VRDTPRDFIDLGNFWHEFSYEEGRILSAVGRDSDGSLIVAFVYGSPPDFKNRSLGRIALGDPEPEQILSSLAVMYYTAAPPS